MISSGKYIFDNVYVPKELLSIANKVFEGERITEEDALALFELGELPFLGILANFVREQKNSKYTFFNKNFHIEPTNICIYNCKFCSYARKVNEAGAWEYSIEDILDIVSSFKEKKVSEVHIVGGVHPQRDLHYYGEMMQKIKALLPHLHIKGFTAVELDFMIRKAKLSLKEGLLKLKEYGLDSIPGGGAEIFHPDIRKEVCDEKVSAELWLEIHETAHSVGLPSNATMLYGHIEKYHHRIHHLSELRKMQDRTKGFNTFIPLKYKSENNKLSYLGEVSIIDDMKNFAVSRIFLDNFPHLKAYWPMLGKQQTQLALSFGVDDIDGTIDDSTKIYSMAGADDKYPKMSTEDLITLIKGAQRIPVERDTLYGVIHIFE
jgi:aminodeoxyfutalosine synthase